MIARRSSYPLSWTEDAHCWVHDEPNGGDLNRLGCWSIPRDKCGITAPLFDARYYTRDAEMPQATISAARIARDISMIHHVHDSCDHGRKMIDPIIVRSDGWSGPRLPNAALSLVPSSPQLAWATKPLGGVPDRKEAIILKGCCGNLDPYMKGECVTGYERSEFIHTMSIIWTHLAIGSSTVIDNVPSLVEEMYINVPWESEATT